MKEFLTQLFDKAEGHAAQQQEQFEKQRSEDVDMYRRVLVDPNSSPEQRTKAATEIGKLRNLKKGENPFNKVADHLNTLGEHVRSRGGFGNKLLGGLEQAAGAGIRTGSNILHGKPNQEYPSLPPIDPSVIPSASQGEDAKIQNMTREAAAERGISEQNVQAEFQQAEKVLGRPLTEDEKLQMLKLVPKTTGGVVWGTDGSGKLVPMKDVGGKLQPIPTPEGVTPVLPSTLPTTRSSSSTYDAGSGTTTTRSTSQKTVPGSKPSTGRDLGGAKSGTSRVKAMADDWARGGVQPGQKDRAAVEQYMADNGMEPGQKPTQTEIKLRDDLKKVEPMVDRLEKYLSENNLTKAGEGGMFSPGAWGEKAKVEKAWQEYNAGLPPKDKQLGELVKMAAAIKIMGAAPWMSIGRGKYLFSEVVKHLPNETDTPAQLNEKVKFYRDILEDAKASLPKSLTSLDKKSVDEEIMEAVHGGKSASQPSQR
jgi:hypothetical protein